MDKKNNILSTKPFGMQIFAVPKPEDTLQQCIGSNQKHLLVVYKEDEQQAANKDFLAKILGAAKFDIERDILLLKITNQSNYSFTEISNKKMVKYALFFGVTPGKFGLNFNFQLYQHFTHQDIRFMVVDDLAEIAKNKQLKAALWNSLKEMFDI